VCCVVSHFIFQPHAADDTPNTALENNLTLEELLSIPWKFVRAANVTVANATSRWNNMVFGLANGDESSTLEAQVATLTADVQHLTDDVARLTADANNHNAVVNDLNANHAAEVARLEGIITKCREEPVIKTYLKSKKKAVRKNDDSTPSTPAGGS